MKRKYRVRTVYHDTATGYKKEYYIQKRVDFHWFSLWRPISTSSPDGGQVLTDCVEAQNLYETQHDDHYEQYRV
jgi:hypothetical protein